VRRACAATASAGETWSAWSTGTRQASRLFGVLRSGAAASVLPVPLGLAAASDSIRRIGRIVESAGIRHLLIDPRYGDVGEALRSRDPRLTVLEPEMAGPAAELPALQPGDLAIVQFTSGTTGRPRGVMLTHRAVIAGLRAIVVSAALTPRDVHVQWIPTYHDMGLFGLLSQVLNGATAHVLDSLAFLRDPGKFLRYLSDHGATVTTGPNFSYDLLAAAVPGSDHAGPLDLGRMRIAFNGAEPVNPATVTRFGGALERAGLRPSVMFPCYGMAEATLAVTFPPPGRPPRIVHVDRAAMAGSGLVRAVPPGGGGVTSLVSVGRPVHGIGVRVVDEAGAPIGEGRLGEIQIRGDAVTTGYYRDPEATARAFAGPWFQTGDIGFTLGGELFIGGRRKEMIIVHGRNFFPEDAEVVASGTAGVYRGHCVAFAADGGADGEAIGVVAETALAKTDHAALAEEIRRRVSAELGLAAVVVHIVPPRYLTRTTSGKWQRLRARDRLHARSASCPAMPAEVTA